MGIHDARDASDQGRGAQVTRRALLGAGAAAAAGLTFGLGAPAFADARPAAAPGGPGTPITESPFGPVVVAGQNGRTSYARAVQLSARQPGRSRTLLATYQGAGGAGFPLYRSEDEGRTWALQSTIPVNGFALQPFLYELPRAFAGLPKGALLFSCNTFANFSSTNIQLYASTDEGMTWQFLSTVAQGGPPDTTNGATPVWEPFLLLHQDNLVCYYSDQRDPDFGQKLAHQTSRDLRTWGPVVNDATGTTYANRPGMTTIAQIRGDLWIMTYEYGVPDDPENPQRDDYSYPIHYRLARDPESFRFSQDMALVPSTGAVPNGAPVVSWSPSGGKNGTIIVTDNDDQDFMINRALGDPGAWTRFSSPMPAGYSRYTIPLVGPGRPPEPGLVFVITGAQYGKSGPVEAGIISLGA
ncbi:hypothetical protein GCM10009840_10200 [Pseudolysinimonas kribbensis]